MHYKVTLWRCTQCEHIFAPEEWAHLSDEFLEQVPTGKRLALDLPPGCPMCGWGAAPYAESLVEEEESPDVQLIRDYNEFCRLIRREKTRDEGVALGRRLLDNPDTPHWIRRGVQKRLAEATQ